MSTHAPLMRQWTASLYIIEQNKALLIFHPKLKKWLPPGGHVEENELPHEAAKREAKEETGFDTAIIDMHPLRIHEYNAQRLPQPFMCLLENIPEYKNEPQHQHIDWVFVARPLEHNNKAKEKIPMQWFSLQEIKNLSPSTIFEETKDTLTYLLSCKKITEQIGTI